MKYLACILCGFILGSVSVFAQSPFLDFGAIQDQDLRNQLQQWYTEKEIRNGRNPYTTTPCE